MRRSEDNLHLRKLVSEERGCFSGPYPFANVHARFLFYRGQLGSLPCTPHEDYRCAVTLMSGLPGAGKDTWLAQHRPELAVVSLDSIRAELDVVATGNQGEVIQAAREQCREHLRMRCDFALNATKVTRQMRQRWIDLFPDYSARIELVYYLEPLLQTILAQNRRRVHPVPEKVIADLLAKREPPTVTEGHCLMLHDTSTSRRR